MHSIEGAAASSNEDKTGGAAAILNLNARRDAIGFMLRAIKKIDNKGFEFAFANEDREVYPGSIAGFRNVNKNFNECIAAILSNASIAFKDPLLYDTTNFKMVQDAGYNIGILNMHDARGPFLVIYTNGGILMFSRNDIK